eukprot:TRINITY_DN3130_c0_g1_i1.p1 TRINITY_DN3130_c0_g1~~TRINITY_DN3130_c0_g1_i1.p1  ORF type:complete len:252 (+),score=50.00 TRINITY_DN3130_c0_g1_i1:193-948(+)
MLPRAAVPILSRAVRSRPAMIAGLSLTPAISSSVLMLGARMPGRLSPAARALCSQADKKPAGEKPDSQVSIIAQATALDGYTKPRGVMDDIMVQPTIGGKVYKGTTYLTQGMLAMGGVVIFGWIVKSVYDTMVAKTSPTQIFGAAMTQLQTHPKVENELGMPIKGHGGVGGRATHQMEHYKGKRADGETYTYIKFVVEGQRHDGIVHVEYKGNALNYLIVEVPATGSRFPIEDNRARNRAAASQAAQQQKA